jgi:hypothetical protein
MTPDTFDPLHERPQTGSGQERRQEPRRLAHEIVVVQWRLADGLLQGSRARIMDRSRKGLGVHMATPISVGTVIALRGGTAASCSVQHCRPEGTDYRLGLLRLPSETASPGHSLTARSPQDSPEKV